MTTDVLKQQSEGKSQAQLILRRFVTNPAAMVSLVLLVVGAT